MAVPDAYRRNIMEPDQIVDPNIEIGVEPKAMSDEQRRDAALREHYWLTRTLRQVLNTSSYQAELHGWDIETIEAAEAQAEQDETDALEADRLEAGERRRVPAGGAATSTGIVDDEATDEPGLDEGGNVDDPDDA
jgi:hypothetical protein